MLTYWFNVVSRHCYQNRVSEVSSQSKEVCSLKNQIGNICHVLQYYVHVSFLLINSSLHPEYYPYFKKKLACDSDRPFHTLPPKILLCYSAMLLNISYYAGYLHLLFLSAYVNSNCWKGNQLLNTSCIIYVSM